MAPAQASRTPGRGRSKVLAGGEPSVDSSCPGAPWGKQGQGVRVEEATAGPERPGGGSGEGGCRAAWQAAPLLAVPHCLAAPSTAGALQAGPGAPQGLQYQVPSPGNPYPARYYSRGQGQGAWAALTPEGCSLGDYMVRAVTWDPLPHPEPVRPVGSVSLCVTHGPPARSREGSSSQVGPVVAAPGLPGFPGMGQVS